MKRIKKYMGKTSELTPEQRDDRRGLSYAAAIHAALFVFMLLGFVSAPKTPNPVQVELWADGTTPTAAAPETEPDTVEEPEETPPEPEVEPERSEEHTSELQSLMRISYAVFCLKTTKITNTPPLTRL